MCPKCKKVGHHERVCKNFGRVRFLTLGLQRDDIDLLKREKERLQSDFAKISQEHSNCLATIENLNKEIKQPLEENTILLKDKIRYLEENQSKWSDITRKSGVLKSKQTRDPARKSQSIDVHPENNGEPDHPGPLNSQTTLPDQNGDDPGSVGRSNTPAAVHDGFELQKRRRRGRNSSIRESLMDKNPEGEHKEIVDLNRQLSDSFENVRNDSNKEIERLNSAIAQVKDEFSLLQGSLAECQAQLDETAQQLAQRAHELQGANETVARYRLRFSYYEQENNRVMGLLHQRDKEYNDSLEVQLQELVEVNQKYEERLNEESSFTKRLLEEQFREQTQLMDDFDELQLTIEDQMALIEELKKELLDKSLHYDSFIAERDVGRPSVTRQPSASAPVNPDVQRRNYADEHLSGPVSRAQLDLAVHQPDVRSKELTVGLTQLLEKRDTLKLRLSNAFREEEELRRSLAGNNSSIPITSTEISPIKSKSSAIFLAASGTELAKDPLESEQNLATKLSEVRNVGYKKDKTFVDGQEARRFQQFAIMQQHINDASRLPPEAAPK